MIAEVDMEYRLQNALNRVKRLIQECEDEGLTDMQYYLDFEDELNKLSVKDHNIENFCKYID